MCQAHKHLMRNRLFQIHIDAKGDKKATDHETDRTALNLSRARLVAKQLANRLSTKSED